MEEKIDMKKFKDFDLDSKALIEIANIEINVKNIEEKLQTTPIKDMPDIDLINYALYAEDHPNLIDKELEKKCTSEMLKRNKERIQEKQEKGVKKYKNSPDINYKPVVREDAYFGVSKKASIDMVRFNGKEWRALAYILKHIDFTKPLPTEPIYIDKKELAEAIGIFTDYNNRANWLKKDIGNLVMHSVVDVIIDEEGNTIQISLLQAAGPISRNQYVVQFTESAKPFFGDLRDGEYVNLLAYDFDKLNDDRAIQLYNLMRLKTKYEKGKKPYGEWVLYANKLKQMFNIPFSGRGAYMDKDGFNRRNFELKVIKPALERIDQNSKLIKLIHNDTEEVLYEKIKTKVGGTGYRIKWELRDTEEVIKLIGKDKTDNNDTAIENNNDTGCSLLGDYIPDRNDNEEPDFSFDPEKDIDMTNTYKVPVS